MESALEWRLWAVVPIVEVQHSVHFDREPPFVEHWDLITDFHVFNLFVLTAPLRLLSWPPLCTVQRRKLRFRGFKCQLSITAKCGTEDTKPCPYGAYRLMQRASNKHVNEKRVTLSRDQCCEKNNAWREMMGGWGPFCHLRWNNQTPQGPG